MAIVDQMLLSETGSTRATAYGLSHKILTTPEQIVVGWLDQPANIVVRAFDRGSAEWGRAIMDLNSRDNGRSWRNTEGKPMTLPVHSADAATILAQPDTRVWFVTLRKAG